jgi:hypothetical protein
MKRMRKTVVFAAAIAAMVIFVGCTSAPTAKAEAVKATQQIEVLSHKNLAMGGDTMPPWVVMWRNENSMRSVMAMPQYKGFYVFIGESTASTQIMATEWANSFEARQQVSTYMNSAVSTTLQATRRGSQTGQGSSNAEESSQTATGSVDDDIKNALSAVSISQVSGLQKDGDYWLLTRTHNSDGSTSDEYRAFVLYIINEKSLNNQAVSMLEDIKKNNTALVNLATAAQEQISKNGLEWGAPEK